MERGAPEVLLPGTGVDVVLSTLEDRADDRGVTLPFVLLLLTGVFVCFTRGVGGSDRIDGDPRGAVGFPFAIMLPTAATLGVTGGRALLRFDATDGFNGRLGLLDRSVDIGNHI